LREPDVLEDQVADDGKGDVHRRPLGHFGVGETAGGFQRRDDGRLPRLSRPPALEGCGADAHEAEESIAFFQDLPG